MKSIITRDVDKIKDYNSSSDTLTQKGILKDPELRKLIEQNKFDELYEIVEDTTEYRVAGLTSMLGACDIDFLEYLDNVPPKCFFDCMWVDKVVLPDNIKNIGKYAFYACRLNYISLGKVEVIDHTAFACTNIKTITLPETVISLGHDAFTYCENLEHADLSKSTITEIPSECFKGCDKLWKIKLPSTITRIGGQAFEYCRALREIEFAGTIAQWKAIQNRGEAMPYNDKPVLVTCTDGTTRVI